MDKRQVVPSLRAIVAQVPDPRARRGLRHPWTALLLLVVVGLLCGANSQQALARWGRTTGWRRLPRLGFVRRAGPSQPTLHRVLRNVDVEQLGSLPQDRITGVKVARAPTRHLPGSDHLTSNSAVVYKNAVGTFLGLLIPTPCAPQAATACSTFCREASLSSSKTGITRSSLTW